MAFSNVVSTDLAPGLRIIHGSFTHTVGAASETLTVGGGMVIGVMVNPQNSGEPVDFSGQLYSISANSDQTSTVTFYNQAGVSAGTFAVLVRSGS